MDVLCFKMDKFIMVNSLMAYSMVKVFIIILSKINHQFFQLTVTNNLFLINIKVIFVSIFQWVILNFQIKIVLDWWIKIVLDFLIKLFRSIIWNIMLRIKKVKINKIVKDQNLVYQRIIVILINIKVKIVIKIIIIIIKLIIY
jgi:hypothetical protein